MGTREKLIKRIKLRPKDFTFDEAEKLLGFFSYVRSDKGKTSGSRVIFKNDQYPPILLHKPHPQKELKYYQIKQLADFLEEEGLI